VLPDQEKSATATTTINNNNNNNNNNKSKLLTYVIDVITRKRWEVLGFSGGISQLAKNRVW
jgi:hypothetical protein